MDEYAYEVIRRKLERTAKFRYCFMKTPLFFRFRMSLKVKHILSLFDELDAEAKVIGLNQVSGLLVLYAMKNTFSSSDRTDTLASYGPYGLICTIWASYMTSW